MSAFSYIIAPNFEQRGGNFQKMPIFPTFLPLTAAPPDKEVNGSMKENVIISIKAHQIFEEEPDCMELVSAGTLERTEEGCTLSYQESELTGLEGTTTVLQVRDRQVTLLRQGQVNSVMVFEEGRQHVSVYDTPEGSLTVSVNTRRLRSDLGPQGGDIEIQYTIDIDNAGTGLNLFQIHVAKPAGAAEGT